MRNLLCLIVTLALAAAVQAQDGAASKPLTTQQSKMTTCNAEAGDRKGDDRKAFMSSCLSAKPETQQDKMKRCNAEATGKLGDERKAYMSDCLKGAPKG